MHPAIKALVEMNNCTWMSGPVQTSVRVSPVLHHTRERATSKIIYSEHQKRKPMPYPQSSKPQDRLRRQQLHSQPILAHRAKPYQPEVKQSQVRTSHDGAGTCICLHTEQSHDMQELEHSLDDGVDPTFEPHGSVLRQSAGGLRRACCCCVTITALTCVRGLLNES